MITDSIEKIYRLCENLTRKEKRIPNGVKIKGKSEKTPAMLASTNVRKYACLSVASKLFELLLCSCNKLKNWNTHLSGTRTRSTAFSCTCQPNKNDVQPDKVKAVRNDLYLGLRQSLINQI